MNIQNNYKKIPDRMRSVTNDRKSFPSPLKPLDLQEIIERKSLPSKNLKPLDTLQENDIILNKS